GAALPRAPAPGAPPRPPPGRPMNLLVVGSDTRQGLGRQDRGQFGTVAGQRGDVILLVPLVPAPPRGPEQPVENIKADFGIPVSHYVLVDFDGFRAVVDAVGGLRLDFPSPVRADENGHNNSGLLITPPGCRQLDGTLALALARSRYYQYRGAD